MLGVRDILRATLLGLLWMLAVTSHAQNWNWSRLLASDNALVANSIAIDPAGNSYVVGSFSGAADFGSGWTFNALGQEDMYLAKYDNAGNPLWVVRGGMSLQDNARDVKLDAAGNIYVIGEYSDSIRFQALAGSFAVVAVGGTDAYIAKFDPSNGNCLWLVTAGGTGGDTGYSLALMGTDLYAAGSFEGTASFGGNSTSSIANSDAYLAKLNTLNQSWTWVVRGGASGFDRGSSLCTDGSSIYMAGHFQGFNFSMGAGMAIGPGGVEGFLAKVSPAGATQWINTIGNPSGSETPTRVVSDGTDMYVTGNTSSAGSLSFKGSNTLSAFIPGSNSDMWLAKVTTIGSWVWARADGGPNNELSMALIPLGSSVLAVAGSFESAWSIGSNNLAGTGQDCFFSTFSAITGQPGFAKAWGGNGNSIANGIGLDPNCNIIAAGDFDVNMNYLGASNLNAMGVKNGHLASVPINLNLAPTLSPATAILCPGDSITLTLSSVPFSTISWEASTDNGATWQVIGSSTTDSIRVAPQAATLYRGTYSGNCGSGADTADISLQPTLQPSISALPDTVCATDPQVTFTFSPASPLGALQFPAGFTFLGGDSIALDPGAAATGWSLVTYTDTAAVCPAQASDSVFIASPIAVGLGGFLPQFCEADTMSYLFTGSIASSGTISSSCGCLSSITSDSALFQPSNAPVGTPITITYTYFNGCANQATQVTLVNPQGSVAITGLPASACVGDSSFMVTATDTSGSFSPVLPGITDHGDGTATIDPSSLPVGSYTITYTVNTGPCPATDTAFFTVNPLPMVSIGGLTGAYCATDMPDTVIGTPAFNYTLNPQAPYFVDIGGGQGQFIPALAPLDILIALSYTHTSAVGCSATATDLVIVHSLPTLAVTGLDSAYCSDAPMDTIQGNFPITGIWGTAPFLTVLSSSAATVNPALCTLDSVSWVSYRATSNSGCSATDSFPFLVSSPPKAAAGPDIAICEGDSTTLGEPLVSGYSYQWILPGGGMGATTPQTTVSPSATSTFQLLTTNSSGCNQADSVTITVYPAPLAIAGPDDTLCLGDSLLLQGAVSGATSSQWTDGNGWSSTSLIVALVPTQSRTYTLVVQGTVATCSDSDQVAITVVSPATDVDAGPDLNAAAGEDLQLQAQIPTGGSGSWICPMDELLVDDPGSPNGTIADMPPGTWTMIWEVASAPCPVQRDSITITVTQLHLPTGFSPNGDGMNDVLVFAGLGLYAENKLQIFNRWGNLIVEFTNYANDWDGTNAQGQPLTEDTYFYILDLGDGQAMTRYLVLKRIPE